MQSENLDLKMQVTNLEHDLLNERNKNQEDYNRNLDVIKHSLNASVQEEKVKSEEILMKHKEDFYKLTLKCDSLLQQNLDLNADLTAAKDRVKDLEAENFEKHKENYILNNELDFEQVRAEKLYKK